MLRGVVKDKSELKDAQYMLFEKMNKDSSFTKIRDNTQQQDDSDDEDGDSGEPSDGGDSRRGSSWGSSDFDGVGGAYDDDFQEEDPDNAEGYVYAESVGSNFVKWATLD